MKRIFILLFAIVISLSSIATTYTSVSNGNWLSVTTWTPTGIPLSGDEVIINHTVTIDTSWTMSGIITINTNGTLKEDQLGRKFLINSGGVVTNNGTFSFSSLINLGGTFTNNGNSNFYSFIYNTSIIHNYGNIAEADSFQTTGAYTNYINSTITCDSILNQGTFNNLGTVTVTEMYNDSNYFNNGDFNFNRYYNNGYFENNGTITSTYDATNAEIWINIGSTTLQNSFTNSDTLNHDAILTNNGSFAIGNSFNNSDTIRGNSNGWFTVQAGSHNSGYMYGEFDFCDATPLGSTPPLIDYNTGYVDATITYCTVDITENSSNFSVNLFPNPASTYILIKSEKLQIENYTIYDVAGRKQFTINNSQSTIDISRLQKGIYFIKLQTDKGQVVSKFIKE